MNAIGLALLAAVLVLLRQPILLVLGAATAYVHMVLSKSKFEFMVQDFWAALDKEILLAVPMFLLAGAVMTRGTIARRLIRIMTALAAPLPGGMGLATVLSCAIFAAICSLWPSPVLRVADRGLREGILIEMMAADGVWSGRNRERRA